MDKNFADIIQRMACEQGKEVLINGDAKKYLADYCEGQFKKEHNIFRQILDAGCGEHINNTDNVTERKQKLMIRLENDNGLSPKVTAEYLDLLGLILKGDTSKCEEVTPLPPPIQMNTPVASVVHAVTTIAPDGFVSISGGTFIMGSPANEPERNNVETQHPVTLSPFYMGKYQVTQKGYQDVMGNNPSIFKGEDLPVEQVSWYDAVDYCNRRSQKEGLNIAYAVNGENVTWNRSANGYRLPTEAEWECACRAGTTTPFNTGNNITTDQANYNGNYPYNNNAEGECRGKTTPVGSFAANSWGLYDMHGNVWEWCWDYLGGDSWESEDYPSGEQIDPMGAVSGAGRVLRGGSWHGDGGGRDLRSACRGQSSPSYRYGSIGFRLVRG